MNIQFKNDPRLLAFAAFVIACAAALVWHGDVTFKEAASVVVAALLSPGLLGRGQAGTPPAPPAVEAAVQVNVAQPSTAADRDTTSPTL